MIEKQTITINFAKGLDTKTDPKQVMIGKFLSLVNAIFLKGGLLQSRNGYAQLPFLPDQTSTTLKTFNGALTAIGTTLQAYSTSGKTWSNRGRLQPCLLSTLPLIRNNTNQSQCDAVIAPNGLLCVVYTDQNPSDLSQSIYRYSVMDSSTGQVMVAPTQITGAHPVYGTPRVYLLGEYFIVLYTGIVSSTYHLYFFSINWNTANSSAPVSISSTISPSGIGLWFDAAVLNTSQTLYIAWNLGSNSGMKVTSLTSGLTLGSTITNALGSTNADRVALCTDDTTQTVWVVAYDNTVPITSAIAYDSTLRVIRNQTTLIGVATSNIACVATGGVLTVFVEEPNPYTYSSSVYSNYIYYITIVQDTGSVSTPVIIRRSLGLASKAFILDGHVYALGVYQSSYQNTYFLINTEGQIIAKWAYENSGGYLTFGLPNISVVNNTVSIPYLNKDLVQSVNKNTNVPAGSQVDGVYSQTGINLATVEITTSALLSAEIGNNLNLTGGITWAYDGYTPVEQGFFLYPDTVVVEKPSHLQPTGNTASGSNQVLSVSSMTDIVVGMNISGTDIPSNTTVTDVSGTTLTMSANSTGTHSALALTLTGNVSNQKYFGQATYEWSDNQGNNFKSSPSIPVSVTADQSGAYLRWYVPTLRLTYKISNPVKIVLYRWSVAQQSYYQTTSILTPTLNDTSVDYVTIIDVNSDAQILGNNLLYTTGGVLENVGPPSFTSVFIFDDRLFGITSEDQNLLWYSKQVIQSTPVEMSDFLTFYVAPNIGAQGNTGPILCGAQLDDKCILFKASAMNYFNGTGADITGNNNQYSQPIFITSTVGCSNQKSIVFTPLGLMFEFASPSGNQIWLLGRDLNTSYIGAGVEDFTLNNTVLSTVNEPGTNQVLFFMSNNVTLMYDYYYNEWGTFNNIPSLSSTLYQGLHTYLTSYGRVFQATPGLYLDGNSPVLKSFTTAWIRLGDLQGYQRAYYFYLLGEYNSPHTLNISIAYDYQNSPTQFATYRPDNYSPLYGEGGAFGNDTPYGGTSTLENFRVFLKQQRCQAFRITITEVYDPQYGNIYGNGVSISGLNCIVGFKKGYKPIKVGVSVGTS